MANQRIAAVDPGRDKCGLAVLDSEAGVLWHGVVPTGGLPGAVEAQLAAHSCRVVVVGNQTYSAAIKRSLQPLLETGRIDEMAEVDERGSTEEARSRYWLMNPPTGWRRLLPAGLRVPPCAVDDYAAIILGERYFSKK